MDNHEETVIELLDCAPSTKKRSRTETTRRILMTEMYSTRCYERSSHLTVANKTTRLNSEHHVLEEVLAIQFLKSFGYTD